MIWLCTMRKGAASGVIVSQIERVLMDDLVTIKTE